MTNSCDVDDEGKKEISNNLKRFQNISSYNIDYIESSKIGKDVAVNNNTEEKSLEKLESSKKWRDKTMYEKYLHIKSLITVEPILACYVMPSVLSSLATQNLYLEKACRVNLHYEDHICDALTLRQTANYTFEESEVQRMTASMAGWKTVLQSAFPCIIILFLGAWSDRSGRRKCCMLLPIVGEFLTSIGLLINTYFFYELPMEVAAITEGLFPALTGGWFTMFMGIFSYIADVTTEESRTLRIGVVNLFYSLGVPVGAALSGILLKKIGFYGIFSLTATLYIFSFIYGYYMVEEPRKNDIKKAKTSMNIWEWLKAFFDVNHVKETVLVAFKKGPRKRRLRVSLLLVVVCVVIGPIYGELAVMYLFTRYRFNWNEVDYSLFSTYSMITSLIGTLFSVGVFSHTLKYDDAIIGVISCTSKILAGFVYAFAVSTWQIYLAPLVEIFNGTSFIAMRSMVSKLVTSDELGKVNSLFGVAEAMMPLVYAPMYTSIYTATFKLFPGAFFLLGGALTFPAVLIFAWMYVIQKVEDVPESMTPKDSKEAEANGHVNVAFQEEDQKSSSSVPPPSYPESKADQHNHGDKINNIESIELGVTESIHCMTKM